MPNADWLAKNWDALWASPAAFISLTVGAFVVAFAVVSYFKNSEISILERRVSDYESKLKVGSPDEAKTKIDRLEGELAGVTKILGVTLGQVWAPLTAQEVADLSGKLHAMPPHRVQLMYLNQLGKDLAQTIHEAFIKAGWSDVTLSGGGGNHIGIIAGAGSGKAGAMKAAIESSTRLKVSVDKPNVPEWGDLIYLFVGINAPS